MHMQDSSLVTYHSQYCDQNAFDQPCGVPIIPYSNKAAYETKFGPDQDIVDEALYMYRANIMFKNFKIMGPSDKLIVYLTCFI